MVMFAYISAADLHKLVQREWTEYELDGQVETVSRWDWARMPFLFLMHSGSETRVERTVELAAPSPSVNLWNKITCFLNYSCENKTTYLCAFCFHYITVITATNLRMLTKTISSGHLQHSICTFSFNITQAGYNKTVVMAIKRLVNFQCNGMS